MSGHPGNEITLMHREDGTPCASTIRNDAGTLRCTEHGRALWGSGRWDASPERCACHAGQCLCVVACMAPGCRGVRHDADGNALEADGTSVTGPNGTPPAEMRTLSDGREVIITDIAGEPGYGPIRCRAMFPDRESVTGTGTTAQAAIDALLGHQKYRDAAYAASEPVRRFRQWVDAGRPPLTVDDTALCTTDVDDDEEGPAQCTWQSRYIVERSDFDASFGALGGGEEACEEHLRETVDMMIDGSSDKHEIRAVVTIRWNKS